MARVDFYVLSQTGEQARRLFACRLAEKAYRLQNSVHIQMQSHEDAERLDELLWTFRDGSFVPHHVLGSAELDSPVTIGFGDGAPSRDLLINLCDEIPAIAESFPRVAELVTSDPESKQKSRGRFATYREQGHELDTHNV
ncbi:MAG: DNA polymerase III subunit chi [Woeseiaceae bacterium]|nr:DNA polymerase III subunit chi [Woeseiaceae bacterium]